MKARTPKLLRAESSWRRPASLSWDLFIPSAKFDSEAASYRLLAGDATDAVRRRAAKAFVESDTQIGKVVIRM